MIPQPALSLAERERYSRQMLLPEIGAEGQRRLKRATCLLIGTGGLGSPAALYLAGAGIGRLRLVDFDEVTLSNLHRQVLYTSGDLGRPKSVVAAERLRALNPEITIEVETRPFGVDGCAASIAGCDIAIDGSDNFATRYLVNDACVLAGLPYVYASVFRHEGLLSVFGAADGPCYRCLYPEPPPPGLAPSCAEGGVRGVLPGIMGCLQATEALKLLIGFGDPLVGRMLRFDAATMRMSPFQVTRDPDCPICSPVGALRRKPPGSGASPVCDADDRSVQTISPSGLAAALRSEERPVLVDVRDPDEWHGGVIPGAFLIPLAQLADKAGDLPAGPVICYCHSGVRSRRAAALLGDMGVTAASLGGGYLAWDDSLVIGVDT